MSLDFFTTPDSHQVDTQQNTQSTENDCIFAFPHVQIPCISNVKYSLSNNPSFLQKAGYIKTPAAQLFSDIPLIPVNLKMEGRRFVDMLQQQQYGGTVKTIQLARALLEELYACELEFKLNQQNASRIDSINPQNIDYIVDKFKSIIMSFYQQVPQFLLHILDYVLQVKEDISSYNKGRDIIDQYLQQYVTDAENQLIQHLQQIIEADDVILVVACSHLLVLALKLAQTRLAMENKKFSVILTQLNDKSAVSELRNAGISVSTQLQNHLPYLLKNVNKAFSGCFEVSANGDVLTRSGTLQIAILLYNRHIPLYFAAELFKFSGRAMISEFKINAAFSEQESLQFAFDVVNHKFIKGIVNELDLYACDSLKELNACKKFSVYRDGACRVGWMGRAVEDLNKSEVFQTDTMDEVE